MSELELGKFSIDIECNSGIFILVLKYAASFDGITNFTTEGLEKINDINFVYLLTENYPSKTLKQFVDDQKNKYQKLIDLLEVKDGNKVLEIGCGWGGFSEYLAKNYNVAIDCITISKKQFEIGRAHV